MSQSDIIWFGDSDGSTVRLVGGKGANLSLLTRAGFEVPAGFTITSEAYSGFLRDSGLDVKIAEQLAVLKVDDADDLDRGTEEIRAMICAAALPADLSKRISEACRRLGPDIHVAVRSSGVAEDLAGASFAGLHDTYLDIRGIDSLLDAVRRCWASLWTARATSYRQAKGFDHREAPIALVVQAMVEADVAGVAFTGNPMNSATDEIVINASWGLGEAVVGGIATPDEFVVKSGSLEIVERRLGAKEVRVVRDHRTGSGTIREANDERARGSYALSDDQVRELAALARRVQAQYEDFPQDIEWCLAAGKLYLLQSRPITGVEFSWDAEVTATAIGRDRDADQPLWSRAFPDEMWTGAVTPLMFSWRATLITWSLSHIYRHLGYDELDHTHGRLFRFHKAKAYFNPYHDRVREHGHRGHDDRDIYFKRRAEDAAMDYRSFKTILSAHAGSDPETREHQVNARREAVVEEVVRNILSKPNGEMKAGAFKMLVTYDVHKILSARDDERHFCDRSTFAIKKAYVEINRRLNERGVLEGNEDFYFLTQPEIYELFDARGNLRLAQAKIRARKRDFNLVFSKEVIPPMYLDRGRPADLDAPIVHGEGVYRGAATSRGKITGTARVIKNLKDIGRVQQGDILVTNSTDPGWTPVFLVISGIVLETGGLLAHGALLAREYGLPAVQLPAAMMLIPDGATVSVDGTAGVVAIDNRAQEKAVAAALG